MSGASPAPRKPCRRAECPPTCALERWCAAHGAEPGSAQALFPVWRSNVYASGNVLFHPGMTPVALFFLCAGSVRVTRADGNGRRKIVRMVRAPGFVGARALVAGQPYAAAAEVAEPTAVCMIDAARFRELWCGEPLVARLLAREFAGKLGAAQEHLADMALRTIPQRVAKLLSQRAGQNGEVELRESREELADMMGTSSPVICRALADLRRRRLITVDGRAVRVLDAARLRAAARLPREGGLSRLVY